MVTVVMSNNNSNTRNNKNSSINGNNIVILHAPILLRSNFWLRAPWSSHGRTSVTSSDKSGSPQHDVLGGDVDQQNQMRVNNKSNMDH